LVAPELTLHLIVYLESVEVAALHRLAQVVPVVLAVAEQAQMRREQVQADKVLLAAQRRTPRPTTAAAAAADQARSVLLAPAQKAATGALAHLAASQGLQLYTLAEVVRVHITAAP
jgi:hypothetical protein